MSVYSLGMLVEERDGGFLVYADWLKEPVWGATWTEAYEKAMKKRRNADSE